MKTLEIYFKDTAHFTVTHVEAEVIDNSLVIFHTMPDPDGFTWTDAYPLATIDWYRWRIQDEKATDTTGQPVQ